MSTFFLPRKPNLSFNHLSVLKVTGLPFPDPSKQSKLKKFLAKLFSQVGPLRTSETVFEEKQTTFYVFYQNTQDAFSAFYGFNNQKISEKEKLEISFLAEDEIVFTTYDHKLEPTDKFIEPLKSLLFVTKKGLETKTVTLQEGNVGLTVENNRSLPLSFSQYEQKHDAVFVLSKDGLEIVAYSVCLLKKVFSLSLPSPASGFAVSNKALFLAVFFAAETAVLSLVERKTVFVLTHRYILNKDNFAAAGNPLDFRFSQSEGYFSANKFACSRFPPGLGADKLPNKFGCSETYKLYLSEQLTVETVKKVVVRGDQSLATMLPTDPHPLVSNKELEQSLWTNWERYFEETLKENEVIFAAKTRGARGKPSGRSLESFLNKPKEEKKEDRLLKDELDGKTNKKERKDGALFANFYEKVFVQPCNDLLVHVRKSAAAPNCFSVQVFRLDEKKPRKVFKKNVLNQDFFSVRFSGELFVLSSFALAPKETFSTFGFLNNPEHYLEEAVKNGKLFFSHVVHAAAEKSRWEVPLDLTKAFVVAIPPEETERDSSDESEEAPEENVFAELQTKVPEPSVSTDPETEERLAKSPRLLQEVVVSPGRSLAVVFVKNLESKLTFVYFLQISAASKVPKELRPLRTAKEPKAELCWRPGRPATLLFSGNQTCFLLETDTVEGVLSRKLKVDNQPALGKAIWDEAGDFFVHLEVTTKTAADARQLLRVFSAFGNLLFKTEVEGVLDVVDLGRRRMCKELEQTVGDKEVVRLTLDDVLDQRTCQQPLCSRN